MEEMKPTVLRADDPLYLCMVRDAEAACKFLKQAFRASYSDDDLVRPVGQSTHSIVLVYVESLLNHLNECSRKHIHIP